MVTFYHIIFILYIRIYNMWAYGCLMTDHDTRVVKNIKKQATRKGLHRFLYLFVIIYISYTFFFTVVVNNYSLIAHSFSI